MSSLKVFNFSILKVLITHQWQFLLSVYFQVWDLPWELGQSARSLIFHENRLKTSLAMGGTSWAPPSLLAGMLTSLFLCMQHLLWFHESSGPFLCRINCFALVFLESFYVLFHNDPRDQVWYRWPVVTEDSMITYSLYSE